LSFASGMLILREPMLTEPVAPTATKRPPALGDQLASLVDAIADGVAVQDGSGALIHANPAAAALLDGEVEIFDEGGAAVSRTQLASDEPPERMLRFRAAGTERWVLVRARPMRGPSGERWAVITLRDMTREPRTFVENQRRLELALSAGAMGVFEWNMRDHRVAWSPEIERMHGIPIGSFEGTFEAYQRDIHPEDRQHVVATVQRTLENRGGHELAYRIVRPDGEVRWLQAHGHLVLDEQGNPERLVGVCRDVTDQRTAELNAARAAAAEAAQHEVEKAHARLSQIFNRITDPFTVLDRELRVVYANDTGARLIGKPVSELIGRRVTELTPEVKDSPFAKAYEKVLATRKPLTIEEYYPPWDRWYEASVYPLDDGLVVYTRDVTVRKRAMELTTRMGRHAALRADVSTVLADERDVPTMLRRTCEAFVEHIDAAFARIWTLDETGTMLILQASAGMYTHIDGGHRAVPVGKFKIGRIALHRKPHLSNDVTTDPEVGDRAWAQREGMVSFAGYPMIVDGKLVGVLAMFARHALPEDTTSVLATISDLVAQGLVRRRTEIELDHRLQDLARSNAELEQFAYVASHDLQEPLRMVASYNQLLARRYKGKLDKDADDFIGFSVEGVTRMQRLINDLLAYSRVGTRGGERVDVDLAEVLGLVRSNLERAICDTKAIITNDPLPQVMADPGQMLQLLQNLVGNAIKFHRDDEAPAVHVGVKPDGKTFYVKDNGIGIDPQFFDRIFVIFQRLNAREKYPGTGIGLAICKKIVERHGGRIWVESEPGKGSTVLFTLAPTPRRSP
jgi:PAS domain S-box-containing protein